MGVLIVREALSSDLDELVELHLLLQSHCEKSNESVWKITAEGRRLLKQKMEDMLKNEKGRIFVAETDGEITGYASGETYSREDYLPSRVASINNIYIRKDCRKRGIGRKLIEKLCKFFDSTKAEQVTLRYIVGNRQAEDFWTELGFKPVIMTAGTTQKT